MFVWNAIDGVDLLIFNFWTRREVLLGPFIILFDLMMVFY